MSGTVLLYDAKLKRPGCVLLQAALGGDTVAIMRFPSDSWIVCPTPDLHLYCVTDAQLDRLVQMTEAVS